MGADNDWPSPRGDTARDRELARRCVEGDEEAQRAFVVRFSSLVFSLCTRSGLAVHEAEDVCQEVLLDAFRALHRYRGEARLTTWLYTIAHRRLADHLRSAQRRQVPSGLPGDATFPEDPAVPDSERTSLPEGARLTEALTHLGEPARAILLAYYLGEMPVAEIARVFGLPTGTVKTHLHRGRQALRRIVKP